MEEILNAVTHGIGTMLALAGLIILVVLACIHGNAWHIVSVSIYGVSLFLLYLASTLYHSFTNPKAKYIFKIFDHAAIYLLIAGTYTPFSIILLPGVLGWTILGTVWTLAVGGIILKIFFVKRFKKLSTVCYIAMGWMVVVFIKPLAVALPVTGLLWLFAGGLLYTVGTLFYLYRRIPYNHAIWHLFVLGGSVSHFIAILYYVLPTKGYI